MAQRPSARRNERSGALSGLGPVPRLTATHGRQRSRRILTVWVATRGNDGEQRRVQPTLSREGGEAEQVPDGRDAEGDRFEDAGDEQRQPQEGVLAGLDEARSAIGASVEDGEELPCGDRDERQRLGIGTFQAEAGGDAVVGTETDGGDEAAWVAMRRKVLRPMTGSSAGRGGSFMVS